MPEVGTAVSAMQPCGEVESTKSVSDVYSPVTGTVTERNPLLEDRPELVNSEPYGEGWLLVIDLADGHEPSSLMGASAYRAYLEEVQGQ
jgi:glycine cleavage system H protein